MATKKPAKKKSAKKAASKKTAPKKGAPKKPAAKKTAPKKPAAKKPAAKKPAAKKPVAKKAAPKKPAAKKTAPKKTSAAKAPAAKPAAKTSAAKAPAAKPAAEPAEKAAAKGQPKPKRWTSFPPVLEELASWVNEGRAGEIDFEMYASFNEQYKPSDWTRNPSSDDELFTFGMDGSGGQVALWRCAPDMTIDAAPVVFLGSEGEVRPLATSLAGFLYLVANGLGPIEIAFGEGEPTPNDEMIEWVCGQYPDRTFVEPKAILDEATDALSDFEAWLTSTTKT